MAKILRQTMCQNIVFYQMLFYYYDMKIDVTEKESKFILLDIYFVSYFPKIRNSYGNSRCFEHLVSNQTSSYVFNVIGDLIKCHMITSEIFAERHE